MEVSNHTNMKTNSLLRSIQNSMLKPVQLNSVLSVEFNKRGIGIGVTNWQYYAHLWLAATSLTIG